MLKTKIFLFSMVFFFSLFLSAEDSMEPVRKGVKMQGDGESKRWAIVIGVNDYNDIAITDLSKARNDAKIMGQLLKEQGGFEENVFVMTDDLGPREPLYPSKVNIEMKVDKVLEAADSNDLVLFYFSGHGLSDTEGKGYLLPVDTAIDKAYYTSVKVEDIVKRIQNKKIKKTLLVLDACRDVLTTSKSSNKKGLQAEAFEDSEVSASFFSTKAGAYSFEDPKSGFGVFTKFLAMGMEGKADLDGNGTITFSELESYVQKKVTEWSQVNNKKQVPYVQYHREKFGDLPITVRGSREKSLVDDNEYDKADTRLSQAWRSAILPGWGQWYDGGREKAISFVTIWGFLGVAGYNRYAIYQNAKKDYASTVGFQAVGGEGDMIAANYLLTNQKRENLLTSQNNFNMGLQLLGAFWAWNMFDVFYFRKNEYFWSFNLQLAPERSSTLYADHNAPPARFSLEISFKF